MLVYLNSFEESMRRVVITGIGIVSSIGSNAEEVKKSLFDCTPGISKAIGYDNLGFKSQVYGSPNIDLEENIDRKKYTPFKIVIQKEGTANFANIGAGTRVLSVTVDVPTAWSSGGNGDYVEVGDTSNGSRFIRSGDLDVSASGQYHSQYQYEYTSAGQL